MHNPLRVINRIETEPPYPKNTRVKGWKFAVDYERINQSDTWALAPPDMRPWLLMLWLTAWQQCPAGSFPDDDALIAARIGMDRRVFVAHKDILMRNWERYSDGRLYHPVLVEQVLNYAEHNRKERERLAAWRDKKKQELAEDVTRNKRVCTDTGTGTGTNKGMCTSLTGSTSDFSLEQPSEEITRQKPVPYQRIIEAYHRLLPLLPRVEKLTETRKRLIGSRWRQDLPDLPSWENYFRYIAQSPFLTGQADTPPGKIPFRADLEWLCRPSNYAKVAEEKYHQKPKKRMR